MKLSSIISKLGSRVIKPIKWKTGPPPKIINDLIRAPPRFAKPVDPGPVSGNPSKVKPATGLIAVPKDLMDYAKRGGLKNIKL